MRISAFAIAVLPSLACAFQQPGATVVAPRTRSSALNLFFPDPANTPSNPLGSDQYSHLPGSGNAADCTKPPQLSVVNKGRYERINGHNNPVAVNPTNPFSSDARGLPGKDGRVLNYSPNVAPHENVPINPSATSQYGNSVPQWNSGHLDDCTKPPQLSVVNKGRYERLNGHNNPVAVNPSNPFSSDARGMPGKEGRVLDYSPNVPSHANVPINPIANYPADPWYDNYPNSGQAADCTKPPQLSVVNKGRYERLNGHNNPVAINPSNPFSSDARGMPGKEGRVLNYSPNVAPHANVPINPLADYPGDPWYDNYPHSGQAADCTKPPQLSVVNKGRYERLNGHNNPVAVNPSNPFSSGARGMPGKEGRVLNYSPNVTPHANVPINPLANNPYDPWYDNYPHSGQAADCTKPPQLSVVNKGRYERLNGHNNPVAVNPSNPFSSDSRGMPGKDGRKLDYSPNVAPHETVPINPLSDKRYGDHVPHSGIAADCTKPPQLSTLNKGTYEKLNGYGNPVGFNPTNPFVNA